ncbi:MAG TPA: hypothetical protein DEV72_19565 [Ktedonobacter sp.]|nr:hypothetical protein [Ktedonobacter sp.]HCF87390.1 hypothetical protein [Ktedonobacter sp.]HCJ33464.1 hypothetical protein [Ktedonobacter sp.]
MPIYVYQCKHCEERFERLVPMSSNSVTTTCPNCGAGDARKHLSTFAVTLKGKSTASSQSSCAPTGG